MLMLNESVELIGLIENEAEECTIKEYVADENTLPPMALSGLRQTSRSISENRQFTVRMIVVPDDVQPINVLIGVLLWINRILASHK